MIARRASYLIAVALQFSLLAPSSAHAVEGKRSGRLRGALQYMRELGQAAKNSPGEILGSLLVGSVGLAMFGGALESDGPIISHEKGPRARESLVQSSVAPRPSTPRLDGLVATTDPDRYAGGHRPYHEPTIRERQLIEVYSNPEKYPPARRLNLFAEELLENQESHFRSQLDPELIEARALLLAHYERARAAHASDAKPTYDDWLYSAIETLRDPGASAELKAFSRKILLSTMASSLATLSRYTPADYPGINETLEPLGITVNELKDGTANLIARDRLPIGDMRNNLRHAGRDASEIGRKFYEIGDALKQLKRAPKPKSGPKI